MKGIASLAMVLMVGGLLAMPENSQADSWGELEITEWRVPWKASRPRDPWVSSPERVWFVGQQGDYVAALDPGSGDFQRYDLETGTGPHTVIADHRGVWYAGNRAQHIGRLDPSSEEIEKIMLPAPGDAHSMDFTRQGDIWFTLPRANQLGFLDAGNRQVTLYDVPTRGAYPYAMIVGTDDRPWSALLGTHKLATVTRGKIEEIELPRAEARPRRLAVTSDGSVWYVDYAGGYLGRYDPDNGEVDEWRAPAAADSKPYAMAADDRGRPWFVETGVQPNRFVGFDPETETFSEPVDIPSGGGTVRHMVFDAESRSFWFGTDANTIGRARLAE
ncbi:Vgb family protein [Litchfieldella rifensis]|uniref:Lyase n=1 Tax=Litchfieldella rifensis TaxID=762643 RepID=A0ABV7LRR7_9GAMM